MPSVAAISIYVDDLDEASAFYTTHLGFSVKSRPAPVIIELEHEGAALVLCQAERKRPLEYSADSGVVVGVATQQLDAALERLKRGKVDVVTPEAQPFPGGRFVAVRDPAGNVVELLEFER